MNNSINLHDYPFRPVDFFPPEVTLTKQAEGVYTMVSNQPLEAFDTCIGQWLERWAKARPDQAFMVEQTAAGERSITYREALDRVKLLAEGLLRESLGAEAPILILAENSIEHAVVMLAALHVGIPVSPLAPAYALQTVDYAKLKANIEVLTPGMMIVDDGERYAEVIAVVCGDMPVMALHNPTERARGVDHWMGDRSQQARVDAAAAAVNRDTIAKFLFTSGSSGTPKAVINTHGMLCAGSQQQRQITASIATTPPILVDWLPWNHTAGGNSNFHIVLYNGGTLYIDPGKPTPAMIGKSVELLKRVSPTLYFNVPMGFDALLPYLEADEQLLHNFFKDVEFLWYAAAAMQPATWEALETLAVKATGKRILIVSGLGMTETSPIALFGNKRASGPGVMGVPAPGLTLKLVDAGGGQWEARYKGPNLTPGYWRNEKATAEAFDDEGYFISGDLVSFIDENDPELGLRFEGRQSEDFKLSSGTRVAAGALRLQALEQMQDLVNDLVVVGDGQKDIRLLIFPDWQECVKRAGLEGAPTPDELAVDTRVKALFEPYMQAFVAKGTGSSNRLVAAVLVATPASEAQGEITQKGTLNRRVLERNRPELIQALFNQPDDPRVITG